MVLRKSICNLSKYGKKNDDLLTPVLSDCRMSDLTSIFSRSLVSETNRDPKISEKSKNTLRSNSFNRSKYVSTEFDNRSNSYRRAHSVSFSRNLKSSLPVINELKSNQVNENKENDNKITFNNTLSNLENVESIPRKFDLYDLQSDNTRPKVLNAIETSKDFFGLTSFTKPITSTETSLIDDLFNFSLGKTNKEQIKEIEMFPEYNKKHDLINKDEFSKEYLFNKEKFLKENNDKKEFKINKNDLWKRLRIGAFAPLGLGVLDGGALSSLSIKGKEKTDLSGSKVPRSQVVERLLEKMERLVNQKREKVAELHKKYSEYSLGEVTLGMLFSGLKDVPAMVTETSELDPYKGIRFRGFTVDDLLQKLPGKNPDCPYTEAVLWFLLTGEVPTLVDVDDLSYELYRRSKVPDHVFQVLDSFPRDTHPMTQYVSAVSALQTESVFRKAYFDKTYHKDTCWKLVLEDCLDLVAKNVVVVGYIYRRCFLDENTKPQDVKYNSSLDYGANLAHFLGDKSELFSDLMRMYLALHSDHEGGNVSAHASHLVGSALADPYFCFASALCGLSGPLHGMANQECLLWVKKMLSELGDQEVTVETVKKYAEDTMAKRQVIPGYGHAVLKVTDPRHTAFVRFASKHFPEDPLVQLLDTCLKAIPEVLKASGKVRNPNPNVDCSTGVLLSHFNVDQPQMYTVFFGLSRSLGILSQLVWARALRYPIERPKSLSLDTVERMCHPPETES